MKALRGSERIGASECRFIRDGDGRKSRSLSIAKMSVQRGARDGMAESGNSRIVAAAPLEAKLGACISITICRAGAKRRSSSGDFLAADSRGIPTALPLPEALGKRHYGGSSAPHDRMAVSDPPRLPAFLEQGADGCRRARASDGREWLARASGGSEATESRAIRRSEEGFRRRFRDDGPAEGNSVRPRIICRGPRRCRLRERDPERRPRLSSRASRKAAGASMRPCGIGSGLYGRIRRELPLPASPTCRRRNSTC